MLELSTTANLRLWKTRDKQTLPMSYTIGTDAVPSEIYVEGYDLGQGTVTWTLKDPSGVTLHSDVVKFTVVLPNLTGYRPQTEGPGYGSPFARTAVPWEEETSPGVGVRFNGDDDDGDGTRDFHANDTSIASENDLIEIEVDFAADAGVQYRLRASNQNIKAWANSNKSGEYHLDGTYALTSPGSIWIEWVQPDVAQTAHLDLLVYDGTHGNLVFLGDRLHFYPFTSVLTAFGGSGSVPLDTESGPFQMAIDLYEDGYDVHAYSYSAWDGAAYEEVSSAISQRGVSHVAIFGHSYGGGVTYDLANLLSRNIDFTAYIDAIVTDSWAPPVAETRLPPGSTYHVNYYETNGWPPGAAGEQDNFRLNVNNTAWGAGLGHTDIDNDMRVRNRILDGSTAGGIEGPHQGLRQIVPR